MPADLIAGIVISAALAMLIGGVVLAFYMDDARWLFMSLVAFIFFYAG